MSSGVKQTISIDVGVTETVNTIINQTHQVWFRWMNVRGLPADWLIDEQQDNEKAFRVWFLERSFNKARLEICSPTGAVVEALDIGFNYLDSPVGELRDTPASGLEDFAANLKTLPEGCTYKILVWLKPGATKVPGWSEGMAGKLPSGSGAIGGGFGLGDIEGSITCFYEE